MLLNGKPVKAPLGLTYDGYSAEQDAYMAKAETGADGMASFKVTKPGLWMLRTEVTEKLTDGSADQAQHARYLCFPGDEVGSREKEGCGGAREPF